MEMFQHLRHRCMQVHAVLVYCLTLLVLQIVSPCLAGVWKGKLATVDSSHFDSRNLNPSLLQCKGQEKEWDSSDLEV